MFLGILSIILTFVFAVIPLLDQFKDKEKTGFFNQIQPLGKVMFVVAFALALLQIITLSQSQSELEVKNTEIVELRKEIAKLAEQRTVENNRNKADLILQNAKIENGRVKLTFKNMGRQIADSLNVSFCMFYINSQKKKIISHSCPNQEETGYMLPTDVRVNKNGGWYNMGIPFDYGMNKSIINEERIYRIVANYVDLTTMKKSKLTKTLIWKGYELSGNQLNDAPLAYENMTKNYLQ